MLWGLSIFHLTQAISTTYQILSLWRKQDFFFLETLPPGLGTIMELRAKQIRETTFCILNETGKKKQHSEIRKEQEKKKKKTTEGEAKGQT